MTCSTDFSEYVEVQEVFETPDGSGGFATSWAEKFSIWCSMEERSGGEPLRSDRLETITTVTFMTHYRDDITAEDRLVYDGLNYNITRVDNLKRKNQFLMIYADSGVPN